MIKSTFTLLMLCVPFFVKGQDFRLLDTIVKITEQNSIYRKNVDWKELEPIIYNAVGTSDTNRILAIQPAVGLMLDALNDNHSILSFQNKHFGRTTKIDLYSRINKETKRAIGWPKPTPITIKQLTSQIGYIAVPGMNVDPTKREIQIKQLGQALRDSLCKLNPNKLIGIIVDMRLNIGGNMYPMFGGIGSLLENGKVGAFVGDNFSSEWNIKNGNLYLDKQQMTDINNNCIPNGKIKIAVIFGPATASSGEALSIAFIGHKNVKTFGEKTGGFTSANNAYKITDSVYFYLASSYEEDRNGKKYTQSIDPEIIISNGDNFEDLYKDKKVEAALNWIKENYANK